jgi:hypothetical protein
MAGPAEAGGRSYSMRSTATVCTASSSPSPLRHAPYGRRGDGHPDGAGSGLGRLRKGHPGASLHHPRLPPRAHCPGTGAWEAPCVGGMVPAL